MKERIRQRFHEIGVRLPEGGSGTADQRWYWAGPALLDGAGYPDTSSWVENTEHWLPPPPEGSDRKRLAEDVAGSEHRGLAQHVAEFHRAMTRRPDLGTPPEDWSRFWPLALTGRCVRARALRRIANLNPAHPAVPLVRLGWPKACVRVQHAGSTALIPDTRIARGRGTGAFLRHALAGNSKPVPMSTRRLGESLGLMDLRLEVAEGIASEMLEALSIRTSLVRMDNIRCAGPGSPIEVDPFNIRTRFALRFGDLRDERGESIQRADTVRKAFNSPFRPFILASTSIGQEGLDFHTYCHAVYHWNLPHNPVDLEQREGRIHRYKGHAVRRTWRSCYGLGNSRSTQPVPSSRRSCSAETRDERASGSNHLTVLDL